MVCKSLSCFCCGRIQSKKKDYLQYRIGKLFSFGYGVKQDYLKAAEWYEKAVAEDNPSPLMLSEVYTAEDKA